MIFIDDVDYRAVRMPTYGADNTRYSLTEAIIALKIVNQSHAMAPAQMLDTSAREPGHFQQAMPPCYNPVTMFELYEATRVHETTIRRALNALMRAGLIRKTAAGWIAEMGIWITPKTPGFNRSLIGRAIDAMNNNETLEERMALEIEQEAKAQAKTKTNTKKGGKNHA